MIRFILLVLVVVIDFIVIITFELICLINRIYNYHNFCLYTW